MSNPETTISLQSYAAVLAGLGAGLRLGRALARAEVPASAWEPASEHWQARIGESAASDLELLVAFDGALSTARRRFEPTIEPITSDPQAWAQFRRHFVTAVDPVVFLAERDLSLVAYARLEADWTTRVLADVALAATLQGHMDAPLGECPALTLTPSPWLLEAGATPPAVLVAREEAAVAIPQTILPALPAPPIVKPSYLLDPSAPPASAVRVNPAQDLGRTRVVMGPPATAPMPFLRPGGASAVLPFPGPSASPVAAATITTAPRTPAGPCVDLGQTVGPTLTPVAAAMPFRPAGSLDPVKAVAPMEVLSPLPELSVEQYAWVVSRLRRAAAADLAGTLVTLRLTPETREQLEAHWRARMGRDPALQQAFIAALGRFLRGSTRLSGA